MSNNIAVQNDPVLTQIINGYDPRDSQFVYKELFPTIKVQSRTGDIKSAGTEFLRVSSRIKVGRTGTPEITVSMSKADGWKCQSEGLKILILREDGENFNNRDWEAGMSEARSIFGKMIRKAMLIAKEKEAADSLTSTSIMTNNTTLSGTSQWSDNTQSDPLSDIDTARSTIRDAVGLLPNVAYMGWNVWNKLRFHPQLFALLQADSALRLKGVTKEQLAQVLEVEKVVIGTAKYESADEGQTSSLADIWGKHFGLMYVNPNPSPEVFEYSLGYEFVMDELEADFWPQEDPKDSQYVRVTEKRDQLILNATAGYLVYNAVA